MIIKTKYDLEQEVYIVRGTTVDKTRIIGIEISSSVCKYVNGSEYEVYYLVEYQAHILKLKEKDLYKDFETAKKIVIKELERLLNIAKGEQKWVKN